MRCVSVRRCCCSVIVALLLAATNARGQAPPAIQIFMPNGDRPSRELRLTLTRDDGRIETVFTDSKGKFQFTGDLGGIHDYMVTIEGDGQTFDTTTMSIRFLRGSVTYQPVFLNPHKGPPPPPNEVVDMASFDAGVPEGARAAYERATKAVAKGQAEEAIGELKRALSAYPQYVRALNDLGVLYLKLNRLDEAAETLTQAAKINKRFYFPRLNLGVVLNRQGKYAEAVEVLGQLYRESPNFPGVNTTVRFDNNGNPTGGFGVGAAGVQRPL